jgi:hypothetical protein
MNQPMRQWGKFMSKKRNKRQIKKERNKFLNDIKKQLRYSSGILPIPGVIRAGSNRMYFLCEEGLFCL